MLLVDLLLLLSGLLTAIAVGAMLFFAAIVTPTIFTALEPVTAGRFLRALFPRYYLSLAIVVGLSALLAALGLVSAAGDPMQAGARALWPIPVILALVTLGYIVARQVLTPRINANRDAMLAGDVEAGRTFQRLHRGSVMLNMAQLVALLAALAWPVLA